MLICQQCNSNHFIFNRSYSDVMTSIFTLDNNRTLSSITIQQRNFSHGEVGLSVQPHIVYFNKNNFNNQLKVIDKQLKLLVKVVEQLECKQVHLNNSRFLTKYNSSAASKL